MILFQRISWPYATFILWPHESSSLIDRQESLRTYLDSIGINHLMWLYFNHYDDSDPSIVKS